MKYKTIICPHCGNEIRARGSDETQKCRWCRRLYKVEVKHLGGKRYDFIPTPMDFPPKINPEIKSLNDYRNEDIYGVKNLT